MSPADPFRSRILSTAFVVLSAAGTSLAAPPLFWPARVNLPVEANASRLAVADFDGDGVADIALTSQSTDQVGVRLGRRDRSFTMARYYPTGGGPEGLAAADLDGDGRLDLVVGHRYSDSIAVLRGTDGGFDAARFWVAGTDCRAVAVRDLDGDGIRDIAVGRYGSVSSAVLLGTGGGGFAAPIPVDVGRSALAVTVGLLNADDVPDLVFASTPYAIVCLGLGHGTFGPPSDYAVGNPWSVAIGDLDRDGHADLVAGSTLNDALAVLLGAGDGTFGAPTFYEARSEPRAVKVADLDGDGILDAVSANFQGANASFHRGLGDGTFEPAVYTTVDDFSTDLAVADVDEDGALDVLTCGSGAISLLPNAGDGSFGWPTVPGGTFANAVAIGDLTGDGVPDLAIACDRTPLVVARGLGDGTFVPWSTHDIGLGSEDVGIADLDRDGNLDVAVARSILGYGAQEVVVLKGAAGGVLTYFGSFQTVCRPEELVIGDFNGDGFPDVATADVCAAGVSVLLGTGDGSLELAGLFGTGVGPSDLAAGDLDGDGAPDLVTVNSNDDDVSVLIGEGDGMFAPAVSYPVASYPRGVAIGDLDRDGALDVVATSFDAVSQHGYVSVLFGDGDGAFAAPELYETGYHFAGRPILADLDGNGLLDLAVASTARNSIMVFRSPERGVLVKSSVRYGTGDYPSRSPRATWTGTAPWISRSRA